MAEWQPFEERERPPQLGKVTLRYSSRRIEIASEDEDAIGVIFAWIVGQVILARRGNKDAENTA